MTVVVLNEWASELAQLFDVKAEARLQVCSLVFVDDVHLCELVQHLLNSGVHLHSLFLVCCSAQLANSVAHRLCIISVMQVSHFVLTDSFQ